MIRPKKDGAAHAREDTFLGDLVPQVTEQLAERRSGDFDAGAGQARFEAWLAAHTEKAIGVDVELGEDAPPLDMEAGAARLRQAASDRQLVSVGAPADVTDVVRHVVSQFAPEELEVVDAVADAWLSDELGNGRSKGAPGAAVGFGVEAVLLSQLLFPIVSGAIGDVLGTIALEPGRLRRKRRAAGTAPAGQDPVKAGSVTGTGLPVQLTTEQAENLRAACQRHARALGLSSAKAALLADAILGALTQ